MTAQHGAEEFRLGPQAQETFVAVAMLGCPCISYLLGSPIRALNTIRQNFMCFLTTTADSGGTREAATHPVAVMPVPPCPHLKPSSRASKTASGPKR